jgi:GTP-binding protein
LVYTKIDKDKGKLVDKNVEAMCIELKKTWENLPTYLLTSAEKGDGKKELLKNIENALKISM